MSTLSDTATMQNWMQSLATHYEQMRAHYPNDHLLIVFDIDGTILDMRYVMYGAMLAYDRAHGTNHCARLSLDTITLSQNRLPRLLGELGVPEGQRDRIEDFYRRYRWSSHALLEAHRPFRGVLEVIRWFQLQPRTEVALNSGRPETLRLDTLRSLNRLGEEFRVAFPSELVSLNARDDGADVTAAKVEGIRHFKERGYRVVAIVDNEPINLAAVVEAHGDDGLLPLHASTIFESKRLQSPRGTVRGSHYDITALMSGRRVPRHVQFVWRGIDDERELNRFLTSEIHWAECVVRDGPSEDTLYASSSRLPRAPNGSNEPGLSVEHLVEALRKRHRRLKLDLSEFPQTIDTTINILKKQHVDDDMLWFSGTLEGLGIGGFTRLREQFPGAIIECRGDFLGPLIASLPEHAGRIVTALRAAGINRLGIDWATTGKPRLLDFLEAQAMPVHVGTVPDLEAFLRASLLQPRSLSANFDFPRWPSAARSTAVSNG